MPQRGAGLRHPIRRLERMGFTKEGQLRESCIANGVLTDSARYGLLRREWKKSA